MKLYIGSNEVKADGTPIIRAELEPIEFKNFRDMYDRLFSTCLKGNKFDYYFTTAKEVEITKGSTASKSYTKQDHYHRNNKSQLTAQFICYDGDGAKSNDESCIPVAEAKAALDKLGYTYILYTTHSHNPPTKNRWRVVIPCLLNDPDKLKPTVISFFAQLEKLCPDIKWTNESKTWSIPWYLPFRDSPNDGKYQSYYKEGRDFLAVESTSTSTPTSGIVIETNTESEMVEILQSGISPLHSTMNKWIYGRIKDGNSKEFTKTILHALTANYDLSDDRLKSRKNDINRLVDAAHKKFVGVDDLITLIEEDEEDAGDYSTQYPELLPGFFNELVQEYMKHVPIPAVQFAIPACECIIGVLGGRTYCTDIDGIGMTYNGLVLAPSSTGKNGMIEFISWVLGQVNERLIERHVIGMRFSSPYMVFNSLYRSGGSMITYSPDAIAEKQGVGLSMETTRYELNCATSSGSKEVPVLPIKQRNTQGELEFLPVFHPNINVIKESSPKAQTILNYMNKSAEKGEESRRHHVIFSNFLSGSIKLNRTPSTTLSPHLLEVLTEYLKVCSANNKKDVRKVLPRNTWCSVRYQDRDAYLEYADKWRVEGAKHKDDEYTSTFYRRLFVNSILRANRLCVLDDVKSPIITNEVFNLAVEMNVAEHKSMMIFQKSGELDGDWSRMVSIVLKIFKRINQVSLSKTTDKTMRAKGVVAMSSLKNYIKGAYPNFWEVLENESHGQFHKRLKENLETANIHRINYVKKGKRSSNVPCYQFGKQ